jgi:hypothetical protein
MNIDTCMYHLIASTLHAFIERVWTQTGGERFFPRENSMSVAGTPGQQDAWV